MRLPTGQRHRARRRGAAVVEVAAVISVFLLLLFGIFEYGRYMMIRNVYEEAAREGARWAVVNTYNVAAGSKIEVQSRVAGFMTGTATQVGASVVYDGGLTTQVQGLSVDVYQINPVTGANMGPWTSAPFSSTIAVQVTGTFRSVLPNFLLMQSTIPINVIAIMRSEAN
jgi:Flp pilus assembly protein TadG